MDEHYLRMALQFGNGTRLEDRSGIGRFGMGLPNSSISQAIRVDVWTWQNGLDSAIHSYLDIREIDSGKLREVPVPQKKAIPKTWRQIGKAFDKSGTLVVWSEIDRIIWRSAKSIIDNSEMLIGRMYRYFLEEKKVSIRLVAFDVDAVLVDYYERYALPNDPLYLMEKTSCPAPFNVTPMFKAWSTETVFDIQFNEQLHAVTVKFSIAKEEARDGYNPGSLEHGQHAKKNVGVSIVRANRELDLDASWSDVSEPRDRWWGVEVNFPPALDELFGVTNNKQSARNFSELAKIDLDSLLEDGQTLGGLKDEMHENEDPRLPLIEIAHHIRSNISTMRRLIKAQTASEKPKRHGSLKSEEIGTQVIRKRQEEGYEGQSDIAEKIQQPEQRQEEIKQTLLNVGATQKQATELAAKTVSRNLKFLTQSADLESPSFFDVKSKGGSIIVLLNINHPAYKHLIELLSSHDIDSLTIEELQGRFFRARQGLELLLMAWARYEDEQKDGNPRMRVRESRWDWGRVARDFLDGDEE